MHLTPFDFFQAGFPPVLFRQILIYKFSRLFSLLMWYLLSDYIPISGFPAQFLGAPSTTLNVLYPY